MGLLFGRFSYLHLSRSLQARRNNLFFSGLIVILVVLACLVSGIFLVTDLRFSLDDSIDLQFLHGLCAGVIVAGYGAHILSSRMTAGGNKARLHLTGFGVGPVLIPVGSVTVVSALLLMPVWAVKENSMRDVPAGYAGDYGENPFAPGFTTTTGNRFVHESQILGSAKCASCHQDIFDQWQTSMHRLAGADPAYVRAVNFLVESKGMIGTRYCEGCHAPSTLLTGKLTENGHHGGTEGTPDFAEGVGCIACHRMTAVNSTEGVASYHFSDTPGSPILAAKGVASQAVANLTTISSPIKHKTLFENTIAEKPESCATCHAQFMDERLNHWGWIKMQDEYTDWLESPYAGQGDNNFARGSVTRCQDCHMPLVKAKDPSADMNGMVRSHQFHTANSVVQQFFGNEDAVTNVHSFLKSDQVRITIEPPKNNDLTNQSATVDPRHLKNEEVPFHFYAGDRQTLSVSVSNIGVGHDFPGGTTDIQEAWITLEVVDAGGKSVYRTGGYDGPENTLAVYKTSPIDRHGKPVFRHDLFNSVGDSFRNSIRAGKSDIVNAAISIPRDAKGPITVSASVRYRKFNQRYANWVFRGDPPPIETVEMARDTVTVPLLIEPPAADQPDGQPGTDRSAGNG